MSGVCGVLLAAGGGRRMGRPKATLQLSGESLLDRAVTTLQHGGCGQVFAVLGAVVPDRPPARTDWVTNADWQSGMASSLRAGLAAAGGSGAAAAVVALVDQPGITAAAVRRLVAAHRPGRATCATYHGELGTPVLLDAALWADVCAAVRGDAGARYWLRRHPELVIEVGCEDVADPTDLDAPEDVQRWKRTFQVHPSDASNSRRS